MEFKCFWAYTDGAMPEVSLVNEFDAKIESEVWELLCACDTEFVPPLSARDSPLSSNLLGEIPGVVPTSYFQELKKQELLIATHGGSVVGFLSFRVRYCNDLLRDWCPSNHVTTICVSREFRGQGIAFRLYQFLSHRLPDQLQNPFISTRTWSTNKKHLKILKRLGFNLVTVVKDDRGDGIDTCYFAKRPDKR
jgi:ribosomal protein S18 acetylase RimI-like enzyme